MYGDMNSNYSTNNGSYPGNSRKQSGRKHRIFVYIALVLVTSLISSAAAGSLIYAKLSGDLRNMALAGQTLDQQASTEQMSGLRASKQQASTEQVSDSQASSSAAAGSDVITGSGTADLRTAALAKGSDVTAIAKKAGPSIVGIRMTVSGTRKNYLGGDNGLTGEGSGIVLSKDGYIMTNYHVVSYADPKSGSSARTILEVFLPDGRQAKATFKGGDSKTDLAVIKVNLNGLPVAELGDSSQLEVGELAVAIGNPLGMEFAGSVTVGVISALNRTVELDDRTMSLIQTDAAINEGNSGGALLNSQGQVIGINSVKIAASGVEGLGFAIPINDAKPIVDQLRTYGKVKGRPFIGISGSEVTDTYSSVYDLPVGIYIDTVTPGSGAEKAGLQSGDVIVAVGGKTIKTMSDLDKVKEAYKPGDKATFTIVRDGSKMNVSVTFGEES
ncbi:MAG TPA: trypsin-like peptidase domain-containing protein [Clostridia bacterium]|nr:trypsin-like peptidase domain-containing protein [Clostridia bacterium]